MNVSINTAPISPLRQRMQHDMMMRGLGPRTQKDYLRHVKCLAASSVAIRARQRKKIFAASRLCSTVGPTTINSAVSVLRFLFNDTLRRYDLARALVVSRIVSPLPEVLSIEEAARLLQAAPGIKYKAALGAAYGAGLRVSEVAHLNVDDIDSTRMLIRVKQSKGGKDRNGMLSPELLELLRIWWRKGRKRWVLIADGWLFPGQNIPDPISTRQSHRAFQEAAEVAGIRKSFSPHTLRHSFATHLLE